MVILWGGDRLDLFFIYLLTKSVSGGIINSLMRYAFACADLAVHFWFSRRKNEKSIVIGEYIGFCALLFGFGGV